MYPNQPAQGPGAAGPGQWPPQQPPGPQDSEQPPQQAQHQHSWTPAPHAQYQASPGQHPHQQPPPRAANQIPPPQQQQPGQAAMQTLQPQPNHDQYRSLPPPVPQMYPPPYQQMGYPPTQPAPRQRTAIACRYCRRRKIRCSGFDQSEDGRCTNCQRFSQECVFTPVSAQTQAFVPAHTVWRGQNPPPNTQLYGAYGQPLPQHGSRDGYPPQQQQQQQQPGQYPPPPQGYQQQPQMYPPEAGRKRGTDEPHTPTLPPPNPAQMQYADPSGAKADGSPEMKKERNVKDVGVQVEILK